MAPGGLTIVNDTIIASGPPYSAYTPRDLRVGDAGFVLVCALPPLGAFLVLLARDGWWKKGQRLSIQTVAAVWLLSIGGVGFASAFLHGATPRAMFVYASLHAQVEVVLDAVLLGLSARTAFALAWAQGLVLFLATLALPSPQGVFVVSSIIGGGNDAFFFLLYLYGKQYLFALGVFGHLLSGGAVFGAFIHNIGAVPYNALLFVGLWLNVGFTVAGIVQNEAKHHEFEGAMVNPLDGVRFSKRTLLILAGVALTSSVVVTLLLVYG